MDKNKINMEINSEQQLHDLFTNNKCIELNESSYTKTIYVKQSIYESLIPFDLNFEPYCSVAKECLMDSIQIMKSAQTNRFYIGFANLGGHYAVYEIRPVRLKEIKDIDYIKKMFNNYGQGLDFGIDLSEKYEI